MDKKNPQPYIAEISKATAYYIFKNGPVGELLKEGKISAEEAEKIQTYLQNHMAYLYTVLLEENNLKKFELITNTMNKFYVDDKSSVEISDDGFDKLFESLFPKTANINLNL